MGSMKWLKPFPEDPGAPRSGLERMWVKPLNAPRGIAASPVRFAANFSTELVLGTNPGAGNEAFEPD